MEKISVISNADKIHSFLPLKPIEISFHKVTKRNPLEENLKKVLSLDQYWIDDCFLSPDDFRMELRKEKRRVERSTAPLSIVLFQLDESVLNNKFQLKQLLNFLRTRTRETDIKGWVHSKAIGLIFLDTNDAGLKKCVDLIVEGNGNGFFLLLWGPIRIPSLKNC